MSPDPIFIQFPEVAFCSQKPNFIQAALRDLTKKSQFLSKHIIMSVLSGVLEHCQKGKKNIDFIRVGT
jgi:hypothetical protein